MDWSPASADAADAGVASDRDDEDFSIQLHNNEEASADASLVNKKSYAICYLFCLWT